MHIYLSVFLGLIICGLGLAQDNLFTKDNYTLVWHDEFEGSQMNPNHWDHRGLGPRKDGVIVKESIVFDGRGELMIVTRKVGNEYHTGMISTQNKYEPQFGYFECRVKFHKAKGHWPAFWLQTPTMGSFIGDTKKAGVEIDVFEKNLALGPEIVQLSIHYDGYGTHHKQVLSRPLVPGINEGWHVFGMEWKADEYIWYIDGKEMWRTTEALSHRPEYMILDFSINSWAGDISQAILPDTVWFDYVRVYKPGTVGSLTLQSPNGSETWTPGTVQPIKWQKEGDIHMVKIEYQINGGEFETIVTSTENDGEFKWEVPEINASSVVVRVSSLGGAVQDISNESFQIGEGNVSLSWPDWDTPVLKGDRSRIIVTDILGRPVSEPLKILKSRNNPSFKNGIYFIHTKDKKGNLTTQKLIRMQ